ncbi:MAG: hypothetical protein LPJ89_04925, partial [Hymenobacteraceae bacterium]|nr:hypothetical protein [Hymenobacteraceae bacterium]
KVMLPGKFIRDSQFKVSKEGNVIVAGLYGNKPDEYSSGMYFMRINPATQQVEKQSIQEFGDDFLMEYSDGKKKGLKGVYGLTIKDIALKSDEGAVVICEVAYSVEVSTQRSNGSTSTRTVYYNGPILVVNVKPSGDIDWVTSIFKWQKGTFSMFHSFAYIMKNDKLYFMYNDHKDNIDKYSVKKLKWLQGKGSTAAVIAIVDGSGKYVKANMFDAKDYKTVFLPRQFFHSDTKNIIYSTYYGIGTSRYRFGSVSIN